MKSIGKRLIIISFILALMASTVVFIYLKSLKAPKDTVNKTTIIVAADAIPARTIIEKKMITEIEVPEDKIFDNYIKDSSKIIGKYTKEAVFKNQGFLGDNLIDENDGELTLNIEKGYRAVSINVVGESGVSDLIKIGDYVDIVVYLPEKKDDQKVVRPELAKIILQNIKVLAVDKKLFRNENTREEVPKNYLVTLSIPLDDVEKLVLAEDVGSLKLALRPLDKEDVTETKGATSDELVVLTSDISNDSELNVDQQANSEDKNDNEYDYYTVKRGDSLMSISREAYGVPEKYVLIKKANNIGSDNKVITGEVIKIPKSE